MNSTKHSPENTPVVVSCCRTAIGRSDSSEGVFRKVRGDELCAFVVKEAVSRGCVSPEYIEEVVVGVTQQRGELGGNVARSISLLAGLPSTAAASTTNRLCGSSLQGVAQACHSIMAGAEDVHVVAGVEHMQHLPMDSEIDFHPRAFASSSRAVLSMGLTAEYLAASYGIARRSQEEYALESHRRAAHATETGFFKKEIVACPGLNTDGVFTLVDRDQSIRSDTSLDSMSRLSPAFLPKIGSVTAATSAPLSDGAAAMVVMSEAAARRYGLTPLVRVVSTAVVGVSPALMGLGPVYATRKVLHRSGLRLQEIEIVELNEAFAVQAMACMNELEFDHEIVNIHGGSLAIGHPLGASGIRIATTLIHTMRDRHARLGLATMCIGFGQGIALVFELVE
ncbi:MAG: acetyl-CoA C-acyltransferase [Planctomycetaceae bacterium]|jgi:acetyl-CoA acyltransferase|nr:acetyl-CoA C-acyltransferase [Planctomycetaceae bacterium]